MSKKKHHLRPKYQKQAGQKASNDTTNSVEAPLWDIIADQSKDAAALAVSAATINPLFSRHDLVAKMTVLERNELVMKGTDFQNEFVRLRDNFYKIRGLHVNQDGVVRSGDPTNPQDEHLALIINNQYLQWHDEWIETILPLMESISSLYASAEGLVMKMNPDQTATEGDVVVFEPKGDAAVKGEESKDAVNELDAEGSPVPARGILDNMTQISDSMLIGSTEKGPMDPTAHPDLLSFGTTEYIPDIEPNSMVTGGEGKPVYPRGQNPHIIHIDEAPFIRKDDDANELPDRDTARPLVSYYDPVFVDAPEPTVAEHGITVDFDENGNVKSVVANPPSDTKAE